MSSPVVVVVVVVLVVVARGLGEVMCALAAWINDRCCSRRFSWDGRSCSIVPLRTVRQSRVIGSLSIIHPMCGSIASKASWAVGGDVGWGELIARVAAAIQVGGMAAWVAWRSAWVSCGLVVVGGVWMTARRSCMVARFGMRCKG